MFRQRGIKRTFKHNLSLAILLSFTAGFVNVCGFFAIAVLTTNVTGHVANVAWLIVENDYAIAKMVAVWIGLFFAGSFISSSLINFFSEKEKNEKYANAVPILLEAGILIYVYYYGEQYTTSINRVDIIAGSLMFAMGMQNSIVSMVSGSQVRTSHLTGMFTDLGIEISQLFYVTPTERPFLKRKIMLHGTIVVFYFIGGITGGNFYKEIEYKSFIIPAGLLSLAIFYDMSRVTFYIAARRVRDFYNSRF